MSEKYAVRSTIYDITRRAGGIYLYHIGALHSPKPILAGSRQRALDAARARIISTNPTTNGALFRQPRSSTVPAFYDAYIVIINLYHGQRPYR